MTASTATASVATPAVPELDLVRAATLAPSPDNNQPWRFRFDEGRLLVYEDPTRGLPSDVCSMFSMLALGAAVENIVVEATRHGFLAGVTFIGSAGAGESPVAEIQFSPGAEPDPLAAALETRCTNRRAYSRQPVADAALVQMKIAISRFDGCRVTWLTQRAAIRRMSKLVAVADRLRLERAEFHTELYRQLRLTPRDAERTRDGLDLRTLGLPPGGGLVLRLLKSWPLVRALNRFGLSRMLTAPSAGLVRNSGAIGIVTVERPTASSFFAAGRAFERLWLAATRLGLSVHPLGSVPIFVGHHELLGGRSLGNSTSSGEDRGRHPRLAELLSQKLRNLLPAIGTGTPVMIFRMGTSKPAARRSLRRPVGEVVEVLSDRTHAGRWQ